MVVDRLAEALSRMSFTAATVLYPVLIAVIVFNVVLRYVFGIGSIELEELQWHIYSAAFLLGLPEIFRRDQNIRVDILWRRFSPGTRRRVTTIALFLLVLPFLIMFCYYAFHFAERSWRLGEVSPHSSGLPARYIIKFVLFLAFAVLLLQAVSAVLSRMADRRRGGEG